MSLMADYDEAKVIARYQAAGQEHVLKYVDSLTKEDKEALLQQLNDIPVESLASLLEAAKNDSISSIRLQAQEEEEEGGGSAATIITPFSKHVGRTTDQSQATRAYQRGLEAISKGQVAALVLAGGQGTRLGYDGPKGCYNIGLPSGKSLFQLLSERLRRLQTLAMPPNHNSNDNTDKSNSNETTMIPFYIMTSPMNHDETVVFFEQNNFFGLCPTQVQFFQQGMLPCLTEEGKIIMETPSQVAMAPDGNGGIYPSLQKSGMLDDMTRRGIQYLHVFSIDNALTKVADPMFIGYCIEQNADCGNKVVWKLGPHEKVGVIAERDGRPCIVEYSEISTEMAERVDETTGRLVFGAGNICNHFYTLDFLRDKVMPNLIYLYHIAHKKIPYWDELTQQTIQPDRHSNNNGIKLESFIFDIFPLSDRMAIVDTEREEEFSPVKNPPGSLIDSPDTALQHLSQQAQRWVIASGGILVTTRELDDDDNNDNNNNSNDDDGAVMMICEISPLTSYGGEGLDDLVKGKNIVCPFSL
jgi:UDP-N-acetylglucosamine/UDP-N-acetylgalactosamine diphosphorylase